MKVSFDGIGENLITFYNGGSAKAGCMVKMSEAKTVDLCGENEKFIGLCVAADGDYAAVQTAGYVSVGYTGGAPAVGWVKLAGNGESVCCSDAGREYPVMDVDEINMTVGFML